MTTKHIIYWLVAVLITACTPFVSYAQQCDQTFGAVTIRQWQSQTISDSMTNPSSNPYVVEQFAIEYQGWPSQYVQWSTFTNQPFGSLASDIVDGGAVNRALWWVNWFVVTNAASRDFLIRFKVRGYHISPTDPCIANPTLQCEALSYGDHWECQPLVVTKCGDGVRDAQFGEACDGGDVEAGRQCNGQCQLVPISDPSCVVSVNPQAIAVGDSSTLTCTVYNGSIKDFDGRGNTSSFVKQFNNAGTQSVTCTVVNAVWVERTCTNNVLVVDKPVLCTDPNAENNGSTTQACIYKYACNNNYQCIQQKWGQYGSNNCDNKCGTAPFCGDGVRNNGEVCDFNDGSRNNWGNSGCSNQCQQINNPVCQDPNAENNGQVGACIYKYACNNNYQCIQQKWGQYGSNNCDNKCGTAPTVDVQIVKSVNRPTFPNQKGELITWTLDYKNNGPATATNVVVVDIIPKELTYLLWSVDGSKYTFTAVPQVDGTTHVTWVFKNSLPAWAIGSFTVQTEYKWWYPDNKEILNAVAIVATDDSNPNNNSDSEVTKPISGNNPKADVQITKTVDRATFPNKIGEIITWTLSYRNNGPSAAQNVVVRDVLPEWLEFVSATSGYTFVPVNTLIGAPCNSNTPSWHCKSYYMWNLGTLQAGQTGAIVIVSRYIWGVANATILTNHTDISTTTSWDNPNNNTWSAVTTPYGSGTASLGNYVWVDKDKDGIQDTDEVVLSGVKVDLYKITSCTADLTNPIMTTTTNGSGLYLFTGLEAGNYKVKFTLPNGYEFTMPNQWSDDTLDSDAGLNGVTNCIELKEGENNMTVDAGVVLDQPISCEWLTISPGTIKINQSVSYNCTHKNATSAIVTVTMSGSTGTVVTMTWFTGQFTIGQVGTYNVQCTLDNGITYKVVSYAATGTAINCAYKAQANNVNMCAMKLSLDPYLTSGVNLSGLIYMPTPYPYCTDAQITDTSYACIAAAAGSQILTRVDNMCKAQLVVTSWGGGCKSCGGSNYCGNNRVDAWEECDGNDKPGYICTNQCKYKSKWTYQTGSHNPAKIKGLPSCESIDPPSVNKWEYLPFWWELESDSNIQFVSDCSSAVSSKTNVVKWWSDRSNDPLCHFTMYVDDTQKTPAAEFTKYCYQDAGLTSEPLFQDFFSTRSESAKWYQRSQRDGWSAFFWPSNWSDVPNKYGEYKLALDSSTFYVCEQITKANGVKEWRQSAQRYIAKNDGWYVNECSFNFTVTTPYFVQKGKSLGTTDISRAVMNNFHSFDTRWSIIDNILQISQYQRTSNLTYLGKQFTDKYTKLAAKSPLIWYFRKIAGKEIYVKEGLDSIEINASDLPRGTIISNGWDITIKGNVAGRVMMIANGGTIYFKSTNPDEVQTIEGIYIGDHIQSSTRIRNDNLASDNWANKWWLRIKGIVISTDSSDIEQIYNSRRSYIEDYWFQTNKANSNYKRDAILNGAALTIETDPSFWTSLPPGANELMSALETYK